MKSSIHTVHHAASVKPDEDVSARLQRVGDDEHLHQPRGDLQHSGQDVGGVGPATRVEVASISSYSMTGPIIWTGGKNPKASIVGRD